MVAHLPTEKIAGIGPVSTDPKTEPDLLGLRDETQKSAQKPFVGFLKKRTTRTYC